MNIGVYGAEFRLECSECLKWNDYVTCGSSGMIKKAVSLGDHIIGKVVCDTSGRLCVKLNRFCDVEWFDRGVGIRSIVDEIYCKWETFG